MFCAGLSNMQSMGIGGGFIMNIYIKKENKAYTLDAREITAIAATQNMHLHDPLTTNEGPLSIATPGELKGYWEAHKRFGKLKWKEVMEPTLNICRNGFEMSKHMSDSLHVNLNVKNDQGLRQMYFDEATGTFHKPGTVIKPEQLCNTLQYIAENGGNSLYEGELLDQFAEDLKDMGSIITKEDLEKYEMEMATYDNLLPAERRSLLLIFFKQRRGGYLLPHLFPSSSLLAGPLLHAPLLYRLSFLDYVSLLLALVPAGHDRWNLHSSAQHFCFLFRVQGGRPAGTSHFTPQAINKMAASR
ncbi:AAEL017331-PA [Aedes aegypti]|uniref:AAEL017331-PA n=1 Tax=Aedes aegypti TaxID=7159 RepID=J9HI62_AEDAE|nr:AAEL017331-PA [Aedes aegypti]